MSQSSIIEFPGPARSPSPFEPRHNIDGPSEPEFEPVVITLPKPERTPVARSESKKIGLYAGSFNPFHVGHLNIAEQARRVFDKVVLAQGWNPEKPKPAAGIAHLDGYNGYEARMFTGLLTDFIRRNYKFHDVTLVRGLRNNFDLQKEIQQARVYQDLMPEIKIAYFVCDREFEHVSSSMIRVLQEFGEGKEYLVETD